MITTIGFDADDTLWVNETYFKEAEQEFCELLYDYADAETISSKLLKIEIDNISCYGYGVKAFTLSLIEAALRISGGALNGEITSRIIEIGKSLIDRPVELLGDVETVLKLLGRNYRLLIATKGDILDQERKLKKSGLEPYFFHVETLSGKTEKHYSNMLRSLKIAPQEFIMIGNSLKSDILPVLELGCEAIYIPFHTTWEHEKIDESTLDTKHFHRAEKLSDCVEIIENAKAPGTQHNVGGA